MNMFGVSLSAIAICGSASFASPPTPNDPNDCDITFTFEGKVMHIDCTKVQCPHECDRVTVEHEGNVIKYSCPCV